MIYARQIYKQQLANIGMEGQLERRYFKGVAGVKGQEGEIFGLSNLFTLNPESVITNGKLLKKFVDPQKSLREQFDKKRTSKSLNRTYQTPRATTISLSTSMMKIREKLRI